MLWILSSEGVWGRWADGKLSNKLQKGSVNFMTWSKQCQINRNIFFYLMLIQKIRLNQESGMILSQRWKWKTCGDAYMSGSFSLWRAVKGFRQKNWYWQSPSTFLSIHHCSSHIRSSQTVCKIFMLITSTLVALVQTVEWYVCLCVHNSQKSHIPLVISYCAKNFGIIIPVFQKSDTMEVNGNWKMT